MRTTDESVALVTLHNGTTAAVVDASDWSAVTHAGRWYARTIGNVTYAFRPTRTPSGGKTTQFLHTFLTGYPLTDHVNGDGLDNRRSNLRPATCAQNQWNQAPRLRGTTSRFKGVHLFKRTSRWRAMIRANGKRVHLGYFDTEEEAARAYDAAAHEHFGSFARVNFPEGGVAA